MTDRGFWVAEEGDKIRNSTLAGVRDKQYWTGRVHVLWEMNTSVTQSIQGVHSESS